MEMERGKGRGRDRGGGGGGGEHTYGFNDLLQELIYFGITQQQLAEDGDQSGDIYLNHFRVRADWLSTLKNETGRVVFNLKLLIKHAVYHGR